MHICVTDDEIATKMKTKTPAQLIFAQTSDVLGDLFTTREHLWAGRNLSKRTGNYLRAHISVTDGEIATKMITQSPGLPVSAKVSDFQEDLGDVHTK